MDKKIILCLSKVDKIVKTPEGKMELRNLIIDLKEACEELHILVTVRENFYLYQE